MTSPPPHALSNNKSKPLGTRLLGAGLNPTIVTSHDITISHLPCAVGNAASPARGCQRGWSCADKKHKRPCKDALRLC